MKTIIILISILFMSCTSLTYQVGDTMTDVNGLKLVKVSINKNTTWALVDTGAKTTLLHKEFCDEIGLKYFSDGDILHGVSGESILYKSLPYKLNIFNMDFKSTSNVSDIKTIKNALEKVGYRINIILGADFLKSENCIINYKTNTLECGKH